MHCGVSNEEDRSHCETFQAGDVKNALTEAGIHGMIRDGGSRLRASKGHTEIYRGTEYAVDFVPKVRLKWYARTATWQTVIDTIMQNGADGPDR